MNRAAEQQCATARLYWQIGNWDGLAGLSLTPDDAGRIPDELILYKVQGLFQTGAEDEAVELAYQAIDDGLPPHRLVEALASGAHAALAQSWMFLDVRETAMRNVEQAVEMDRVAGDVTTVAHLRFQAEVAVAEQKADMRLCIEAPRRKLFIDCGGYDGCSVVQFLLEHPDFDCITFEPNAAFHEYYKNVPTQLVAKAVYIYDGEIDFIVDPIDGDGSSLIAGKRIDATQKLENADCPVIHIPCVDLSAFVRNIAPQYEEIRLKMDVEGAEYDILEKMLADGVLPLISKLYCEFHNLKIPIEPGRHESVVQRVSSIVGPIDEWDAHMFKTGKSASVRNRRAFLLDRISDMRKNFFGENNVQPRFDRCG